MGTETKMMERGRGCLMKQGWKRFVGNGVGMEQISVSVSFSNVNETDGVCNQ